jgi:cytochrome oxidase Cu insertion factor (SCO1/SenC/PrrC family)
VNNPEKQSKISLYLIIGLPLIGVILTTLYYLYVTSAGVQLGTKNNGVLITPPKMISEITLQDSDAKPYQWLQPEKKWAFLVVGRKECDQACQQKLYQTRQIRKALGKHSLRIENVYLNLDSTLTDETGQWLAKEHPKVKILNTQGDRAIAWFAQEEPRLDLFSAADFYLVDPQGWVMMYYTDKHDYKKVIKDIKFLLNNS